MADGDTKVILLAGASGLTGALTLDALLEASDVGRVIAVSRRALGRDGQAWDHPARQAG